MDGGDAAVPKNKEEEDTTPKIPPILDEDPWDAQLVPLEPQPFDYDSFTGKFVVLRMI